MATTESGVPEKSDAMRRNDWTASLGTGGRHPSESVVGMGRIMQLRDDMLFDKPIEEPEEDQDLIVWQVLLHVVNHGTDHRAQILRVLYDLGVKTTSQDYIFYVYDHL